MAETTSTGTTDSTPVLELSQSAEDLHARLRAADKSQRKKLRWILIIGGVMFISFFVIISVSMILALKYGLVEPTEESLEQQRELLEQDMEMHKTYMKRQEELMRDFKVEIMQDIQNLKRL